MSEKKITKMLQLPISLELYAKITRIGEESVRKTRQQAIYDLEQVYKNIKLTESDRKRFGIIENADVNNWIPSNFNANIVNNNVRPLENTDDEEDLL
jgi:ferritin-like metal-binding protein YciE